MAGFVQGYKISIHALREEGDHGGWVQRRKLHISIHALREEGDLCAFLRRSARHYFYPRPPRGGRPATIQNEVTEAVFLSTPSARRATQSGRTYHAQEIISIHALREEGDDR